MPDAKLTTLAVFKTLKPRAQGYVSYLEGELPGSELKDHQQNPYKPGTVKHSEFAVGQALGVQEAQDSA